MPRETSVKEASFWVRIGAVELQNIMQDCYHSDCNVWSRDAEYVTVQIQYFL